MQLALDAIAVDPAVQVRLSLDEATIARYEGIIDELPAVVVFQTQKDTLLLADGFHRLEAAKRAGRTHLEADVRAGTRQDALDYAAIANARHGRPLSTYERHEAVRRLYRAHYKGGRGAHARWDAGWSIERIAQEMGYSASNVRRILFPGGAEVQDCTWTDVPSGPQPAPGPGAEAMMDAWARRESIHALVQAAPPEYRTELEQTAQEQDLSPIEVAVAVEGLADPSIPVAIKDEMAAGAADPVKKDESGQYVMAEATIARKAKALRDQDPLYHLERALNALTHLMQIPAQQVADALSLPERDVKCGEGGLVPRGRDYLADVVTCAQRTRVRVLAEMEM